ncbi:MAG: hypothetical protein IT431_11005 [Phycisphaerales bacterium]|nr:hypothetical protein [Phycisphaerales bacterium]
MPTATVTMTAVGLVLCALAFVPGRRGRAACFARGVGMLALAAAPVGIVQAVWVIEGLDFPGLVFGPLMAVPFNMGGLVCAAAFESIDRAGLLEQRQFTLLDNLGVYYPLLAAQTGVLAGIIAARTRKTGRVLNDRVILTVLGVALANGVLGITWPWWGS